MEIKDDKYLWFPMLLFILIIFSILKHHTEIEVYKWYYFILILALSFFIGGILSNFKIMRILIYLVFIYLLTQSYFLIENKNLGLKLYRVFVISLFSINIFRSIAYLNSLAYEKKNIGSLTLLEIKASRGVLSLKEMFYLFLILFFKGLFNIKIFITSAVLTFIIWLIFL